MCLSCAPQTECITGPQTCSDIYSVSRGINTFGHHAKNGKINNFDTDRSEKPNYCDRRGFLRSMPGNWAYPEEWY